jgi:chromosome segregation ATPase
MDLLTAENPTKTGMKPDAELLKTTSSLHQLSLERDELINQNYSLKSVISKLETDNLTSNEKKRILEAEVKSLEESRAILEQKLVNKNGNLQQGYDDHRKSLAEVQNLNFVLEKQVKAKSEEIKRFTVEVSELSELLGILEVKSEAGSGYCQGLEAELGVLKETHARLGNDRQELGFKYSILEEKYHEIETLKGSWVKGEDKSAKELVKMGGELEKMNRERVALIQERAELKDRILELESRLSDAKEKHLEVIGVKDQERDLLLQKLEEFSSNPQAILDDSHRFKKKTRETRSVSPPKPGSLAVSKLDFGGKKYEELVYYKFNYLATRKRLAKCKTL